MPKGVVRIFSFAIKELTEIRRQPRLIASLILGPFLILALFGIGYNSTQAQLRTAVIVPPGSGLSAERSAYESQFQQPFVLSQVLTDPAEGRRLVEEDMVDVAVVLPENAIATVVQGRNPQLQLFYNELDPFQGSWIPYYGNVFVSEVNRKIVEQAIQALQKETGQVTRSRTEVDTQLSNLELAVQAGDSAATEQAASAAESGLAEIEESIAASIGVVTGADEQLGQSDVGETQQTLASTRSDLGEIERSAAQGDVSSPAQKGRLAGVRSKVSRIMPVVEQLSKIPPQVLAAPLQLKAENLVRYQPSFVAFFAPGVLALLLQHLALTLSSLSIVRERLLGALEMFRVAPVGKTELFTGKYIGYSFILLIVGVILAALLYFFLGVPILGSRVYFMLAMAILIFASLSLGFLVSTLSQTDSQAVQFSMILLLTSIFFSGFFLPLQSLLSYVRIVSYALPVTYGITAFKDIMLLGERPQAWVLLAPVGIGVVALFLATRLLKRDLDRR